jgi:hypothetical protein
MSAAGSLQVGGHLISKEVMKDALADFAKSTLDRIRSEPVGGVPNIQTYLDRLKDLVNDKRRFLQGEITGALKVGTGAPILRDL